MATTKLTDERVREIRVLANQQELLETERELGPDAPPLLIAIEELAALADEVLDLRTALNFATTKVKEQSATIEHLERKRAELFSQCEVMGQRAQDLGALLENARTELADAKARGAA